MDNKYGVQVGHGIDMEDGKRTRLLRFGDVYKIQEYTIVDGKVSFGKVGPPIPQYKVERILEFFTRGEESPLEAVAEEADSCS